MRSLADIIRSAFAELRRFLRDPVGYVRELQVRRRLCQMCSLDKRFGNDFETASDVDDVEVLVEVGETILSNRRLIFHSPSVKLTLTVG